MLDDLISRFRLVSVKTRKKKSRRWLSSIEILEDRLAPASNLLVSLPGPDNISIVSEYTRDGTLVRTIDVPVVQNDELNGHLQSSVDRARAVGGMAHLTGLA